MAKAVKKATKKTAPKKTLKKAEAPKSNGKRRGPVPRFTTPLMVMVTPAMKIALQKKAAKKNMSISAVARELLSV